MTAEVAIANGSAVALAADSAVTIGGRKIYNSAIKLFSFSKIEPVGVMIYGSANLLDVPWETIIKTCRKNLGSKKYSSLEEYGKYFIEYITEHPEYFSEQSQKHWVTSNVQMYFKMLQEELFNKIHPILQEHGEVDTETTHSCFENIIIQYHEYLSSFDIIQGGDEDFEKKITEKYRGVFKQIYKEIFQDLEIKESLTRKIDEIATFLHTRAIFSNGASGVVISGFGEDEIYPSILTYEIEGYLAGRLKFRCLEEKSCKIQSGNSSGIIPFAQEDMVKTFIEGMNPSAAELINKYLHHIFDRLPELLNEDDLSGSSLPIEQIREKFKNSTNQLHYDFMQALGEYMDREHVTPILNMVKALPKDELAAMAESLVNLTAFKRKMTDSIETVGGPIDVAVISKGDGFVWVKRKLYFPGELNQNFSRNYLKGI